MRFLPANYSDALRRDTRAMTVFHVLVVLVLGYGVVATVGVSTARLMLVGSLSAATIIWAVCWLLFWRRPRDAVLVVGVVAGLFCIVSLVHFVLSVNYPHLVPVFVYGYMTLLSIGAWRQRSDGMKP